MTLRPHRSEPCWEIVDAATGRPPEEDGGDGWAHYRTKLEAVANIVERLSDFDQNWPPALEPQLSFSMPCLGLFCGGPDCTTPDEPCDVSGEGWTHLDPDDPMPIPIVDLDWVEVGDQHFHLCCEPPWCDDCDEQHYPARGCIVSPKPVQCEGQLPLYHSAPDPSLGEAPPFSSDWF